MGHDPTLAMLLKVFELPLRACDWHVDPADQSQAAIDLADFCLPGDQPVLDGAGRPVPIQDVHPGDFVLTQKGRARVVTHRSIRPYDGELVSLRVRGYPHPIRMTPEHRVPTRDGWKQAGDITTDDVLFRPRPLLAEGGDHATGWLLGLYLAEGSRDRRRPCVTFSVHRDEVPVVMAALAAHLTTLEPHLYGGVATKPRVSFSRASLVAHVALTHAGFANFIDDWVAAEPGRRNGGRTKALRKLPVEEDFARGVVEGWLYGDGSDGPMLVRGQVYRQAAGVTASPTLAHQMQLLAGAIGLPAALSQRRPGSGVIRGQQTSWLGAYSLDANPVAIAAKKRTPELVAAARSLHTGGASTYAVARELDVSQMSAWHWINDDYDDAPKGLQCRVTPDAIHHRVLSTDRIPYKGDVYDLRVEEDHTFCAGPVAVSNCHYNLFEFGENGSQSTWDDTLRTAVTGRNQYGFNLAEICYRLDDDRYKGKVCWDKLAWRPLALDTPIATPVGWSTMADLRIGDRVFDAEGRPCIVRAKSPVYTDRRCYEVVFANGETIVADAEHEWSASDYRSRKAGRPARTVTTAEMAASAHFTKGGRQIANWSIPATHALEPGSKSALPVDPYTLGFWLGDGTTGTSLYSVSVADEAEQCELLIAVGEDPRRAPGQHHWSLAHRGQRGGASSTGTGLRGRLRTAGVLLDKHIPSAYLRAAPQDRLALLQGLMDSDGTVTPKGSCQFDNTSPALIAGVKELLSSLGSTSVSERWTTNSGGRGRNGTQIIPRLPVGRLTFSLHLPAFRLARKCLRQRLSTVRAQTHYIHSITEVPSVPVQCITVDSTDHLFLAGRAMVPTHNSQQTRYKWNVEEIDTPDGGRMRKLVSVTQWAPPYYQYTVIPADKFLLWSRDMTGENYDGPLALNTPIPTPSGWTTMGAISKGDELFDEKGSVRRVVGKSSVFTDRPCYEVRFSSGETFTASADHPWFARDFLDRKHRRPGRVVTTEEMARQVKYGSGVHVGDSNWSVPRADALELPDAALPVDPYVLGAWLGDGTTANAGFALGAQDAVEVEQIMAVAGSPIRQVSGLSWTFAGTQKGNRSSLQTQLRRLGVIGNKHIPAAYRRGSASQRLALLQGLMDTDGSAQKNGLCVFTNTDRALADNVSELAVSLGASYIQTRCQQPSPSHMGPNGVLITGRKPTWQVLFSLDRPAFRIPRKLLRQRMTGQRRDHYVTAITPVPAIPVQCLMTDGPSHLFLAGRRMVPTHNTSLFRACFKPWWIRDRLYSIQTVGLERAYMGMPIGKLPLLYTQDMKDLMTGIVQGMRTHEHAGAVIREDMALEVLHNRVEGSPMKDAIEWFTYEIARSALAQFTMLGSAEVGSFALSTDQSDLFLMGLNSEANYTAEIVNLEPGIPTLVNFNFPKTPNAMMPKLVHGDVGQRNVDHILRGLASLVQWGAIIPDDATEDALREMIGLPEREGTITPDFLEELLQKVVNTSADVRKHPGVRPPPPGSKGTAPTSADTGAPVTSGAGPTQAAPPVGTAVGTPNSRGNAAASAAVQAAERRYWDAKARAPMRRPSTRINSSDRIRLRAAEEMLALAENSRRPGVKPDRPSVRAAKMRRPYQLHREAVQLAEPKPSDSAGPRDVAARHQKALADFLAALGKHGPRHGHVPLPAGVDAIGAKKTTP